MIGNSVQLALRDASYAVDWVQDGHAALAAIRGMDYDMVVLDLGLPGMDGMQVLQRLRSADNPVPVVVISARDTPFERIGGLDAGADDYLGKPFEMQELMARIRALARRQGGSAAPVLGNGIVSLDPTTHEASAGAAPVRLTAREFSLLQALLVRPGAILSRAELERKIYGWNEEVESNAVEFLIHSLRKKLGSAAIVNVRGVGWMVPKNK